MWGPRRRWPSPSKRGRPLRKPALSAPWIWTFSVSNCENTYFCYATFKNVFCIFGVYIATYVYYLSCSFYWSNLNYTYQLFFSTCFVNYWEKDIKYLLIFLNQAILPYRYIHRKCVYIYVEEKMYIIYFIWFIWSGACSWQRTPNSWNLLIDRSVFYYLEVILKHLRMGPQGSLNGVVIRKTQWLGDGDFQHTHCSLFLSGILYNKLVIVNIALTCYYGQYSEKQTSKQ